MDKVWFKNSSWKIDEIIIYWEYDLEDMNIHLQRWKWLWTMKMQTMWTMSIYKANYYFTMYKEAINIMQNLFDWKRPEVLVSRVSHSL